MFCEVCGTQKVNGVCPNCGKKNDSSWIIWTVLKCIFIPFILALVLFFGTTFVSVLLHMFKIYLPAIVEKGILPILQIGIPVLIMLFGWLIILVIDLVKHKK